MEESSSYSACLLELSDDGGFGGAFRGSQDTQQSSREIGVCSPLAPQANGSMYMFPGSESIACRRPPQGTRTRTAMYGWAGCALHREGTKPWSKWAPESVLRFISEPCVPSRCCIPQGKGPLYQISTQKPLGQWPHLALHQC